MRDTVGHLVADATTALESPSGLGKAQFRLRQVVHVELVVAYPLGGINDLGVTVQTQIQPPSTPSPAARISCDVGEPWRVSPSSFTRCPSLLAILSTIPLVRLTLLFAEQM